MAAMDASAGFCASCASEMGALAIPPPPPPLAPPLARLSPSRLLLRSRLRFLSLRRSFFRRRDRDREEEEDDDERRRRCLRCFLRSRLADLDLDLDLDLDDGQHQDQDWDEDRNLHEDQDHADNVLSFEFGIPTMSYQYIHSYCFIYIPMIYC